MPRRTKEQVRNDRRPKMVKSLIECIKWLNDPKFYETNFWGMAHFQSWAVQGKDGGCMCGEGYYSGSLCNTRRSTRRGGGKEHCKHVVEKLCDDCIHEIEKQLGVKFKRNYAP